MSKFFSYTVLNHTVYFPKILIFMVIYTHFVLDHYDRSAGYASPLDGYSKYIILKAGEKNSVSNLNDSIISPHIYKLATLV